MTEKINKRPKLSLNAYVFLLLGGFLLLLATIQLIFIFYIEKQIDQEISNKSMFLTTQAIDIVVSEHLSNSALNQQEALEHMKALQENMEQTQKKIETEIKIIDGNTNRVLRFNGTDLTHDIDEQTLDKLLAEESSKEKVEMRSFQFARDREELDEIMSKLRQNLSEIKIEANQQDDFIVSSPKDTGFSNIVRFSSEQSAVKKYFTYLTFGTFAIALISLFFAYCLARHVTSPLKSLRDGFKSLSDGHFGIKIPSKGVKEVQHTLDLFNQTSAKLEALQKIESKFQQQQHLAELGEISRGMAHSLRNPLNTIGLALDEISQQDLSEQQREQIANNARLKIQALDRTIKSLLMLTTSGIDRTQNVSLNEVIEDLTMQMSMGSHCKIETHVEQAISIKGSEAELTAVLHSLLSNAAEASTNDCVIKITMAQSANSVLISVIDNGQGLKEDIKKDLFKPHVTTKAEGAGMGLYIAKRILSLHYNGDLRLENNIDKGCTATVTLITHEQSSNND